MFLFPLLGKLQANEGLVEALKVFSTFEMIMLGCFGIIFLILSTAVVKDGPTLETRRVFARIGMLSWVMIPVIALLGNWINLIGGVTLILIVGFLMVRGIAIGLGR